MERYLVKLSEGQSSTSSSNHFKTPLLSQQESSSIDELDLSTLESDPGLRKKISDYHSKLHDDVRRAYILKGPCQPRNHNFPLKLIGGKMRRFVPSWFDKYENWLEYSTSKNAAFCLPCYLFKTDQGKQSGGDSFVSEGFSTWNKKDRLDVHIGGLNSSHNVAVKKCEDLMRQKQSIQVAFSKQSGQVKNDYRVRLQASIDCIRFILRQGLAFRGHDESENSCNKGNFLELLRFLADHNSSINDVVLQNAPQNVQMIAPHIQKDIVSACAIETTNAIIRECGDDLFAIIVDEARDVSCKEQMAMVLRYIDQRGFIVERFLSVVHVTDTTATSLKAAIELIFMRYGLSLSRIRGQGYDGASNMQGEFNGLKTLIMRENSSAYYIHCFAHQLQLTLVAVAKNHGDVAWFFSVVTQIINVVGSSCKRRDSLREKQIASVAEALSNGGLQSGRGLNQEICLKRAGDTRWGSHYGSLLNLTIMFSSVMEVLNIIYEEGTLEQKGEARGLLFALRTFDFVFLLHLMTKVLAITNELSIALQRKDQDIINAMSLVKVSKQRLQVMRDEGWNDLYSQVCLYCDKEEILIPNMDDRYFFPGKSRRRAPCITNLHHYQIELFYTILDMQLQELNSRFNETNTELLLCVACLNPSDSFSSFDKEKLVKLAAFYPTEFPTFASRMALHNQLENYIFDVSSDERFVDLKGIDDLARKLVATKKHIVYSMVYLLIKLALLLPVATASVERVFSAMTYIKNKLRNRMCDDWMNDCLVTYIEKDLFESVDNESIVEVFQHMKTRRVQL